MDKLLNQVLSYIRSEALIDAGDRVAVGFSGGADSVCLLSMLHKMQRLLKTELLAVHVHHGIRGEEADRDEAFCKAFCDARGIAFAAVHVDALSYAKAEGIGLEEAARILRYRALYLEADAFWSAPHRCPADAPEKGDASGSCASDSFARGACARTAELRVVGEHPASISVPSESEAVPEYTGVKIAVAHHADDQAETVLFQLARGSGLRGLGGMQPKRGALIRPLLCISREDILEWLRTEKLVFVTDTTNLDTDYTRNYLRQEILPGLRKRVNLRSAEHIAAAAEKIREADAYFAETARIIAGDLVFGKTADGQQDLIHLDPVNLKEKPQILRRYVIIEALRRLKVPLKDLGERHLQEIDQALFKGARYHADLPGGVTVENSRRQTTIYRNNAGRSTQPDRDSGLETAESQP